MIIFRWFLYLSAFWNGLTYNYEKIPKSSCINSLLISLIQFDILSIWGSIRYEILNRTWLTYLSCCRFVALKSWLFSFRRWRDGANFKGAGVQTLIILIFGPSGPLVGLFKAWWRKCEGLGSSPGWPMKTIFSLILNLIYKYFLDRRMKKPSHCKL